MHNVKLLNNETSNDLSMIPSTSSQSPSRRHQRSLSHKRTNGRGENSIDADDMDLALSLAFPNDMENMKKYKDDIWRKTLSSDCDPSIHTPWEKQPEVAKSPAMVWPSTSFNPPKNHFYGDDFWTGSNIFFPTSAPPSAGPSNPKRHSVDVKHRKKVPGKPSTSSVDIDDDFNSINKRLSLSSLRTSLCRQKAVENLNNGNAAQAASANALDDDEFLQVSFFFCLHFFLFIFVSAN
jgi:hypothetical protein